MRLATADAVQPQFPVVAVTTAHVAVGALILAASVILALQSFRVRSEESRAESGTPATPGESMSSAEKILKVGGMAVAEAPALPVLLGPDGAKARAAGRGRVLSACGARASAYLELAKPEVTFLVLVAAGLGFAMASPELDLAGLMRLLLGTGLLAAGTAALNHCLEWADDAKMRRTARRPIPSGRVALWEGCGLGVVSALAGTAYLFLAVSPLAGLIGLRPAWPTWAAIRR